MPPKATASKPVDSPKPGLLIKRPLVNRPLGSAGRGAERLSIAEPAAKAKSPRAADNATVAALRNGAAAAALLARKTPPTARPVDASLKDPKTRGVPRGLVGAADDARADDDVTRMASLARLVNNLPDAASAVEEARQQHGTPLGAWSGDLLVAERPSRSESVENFLRASEQVEANLERLQEALTRASSQDEEFLSQLVGRVDSAIARNPMAPSTPRTPAAGEKHFFGGGGDNEPEESEEQKKLFEEMKAQDFAEANDENEARVVPTSAPGNPTANPAATVAAVAAAGEEAAQLREANALLAAQVAELADALARADERAAWAVQKTETQKQQLLEAHAAIKEALLQVAELKASQRGLGAVRSRSGTDLTAATLAVEGDTAAERAAEPLPLNTGAELGLSSAGVHSPGWGAVRQKVTSGTAVRQSIAL